MIITGETHLHLVIETAAIKATLKVSREQTGTEGGFNLFYRAKTVIGKAPLKIN